MISGRRRDLAPAVIVAIAVDVGDGVEGIEVWVGVAGLGDEQPASTEPDTAPPIPAPTI